MNFEASGLLSLLSGTNGPKGLQTGLSAEGDSMGGFTAALMEQIELLQQPDALSATLKNFNGSENAGSLQELAGLLNDKSDAHHFAALLGKGLPADRQSGAEINLEQTLDSLREVLQHITAVTETDVAKQVEDTLQTNLSQLETESKEINDKSAYVLALLDENSLVAPFDAAMASIKDNMLATDAKTSAQQAENLNKLPAQTIDTITAESEGTQDFLQDNKEQNFVKPDVGHPGSDVKQNQDVEIFERKLDGIDQSLSRATVDTSQVNRQVRADVPSMTRAVDHPQWKQELSERIIWMHSKSVPAAEIRLNPQHLGPISVRIDVQNDQANIAFTAQHAAVRDAIDAAIPKLREMLSAQQLNLGEVNVSQHSFSEQRSSQGFGQNSREQNTGHSSTGVIENGVEELTEEIELSRAIVSKGLLSIRV